MFGKRKREGRGGGREREKRTYGQNAIDSDKSVLNI